MHWSSTQLSFFPSIFVTIWFWFALGLSIRAEASIEHSMDLSCTRNITLSENCWCGDCPLNFVDGLCRFPCFEEGAPAFNASEEGFIGLSTYVNHLDRALCVYDCVIPLHVGPNFEVSAYIAAGTNGWEHVSSAWLSYEANGTYQRHGFSPQPSVQSVEVASFKRNLTFNFQADSTSKQTYFFAKDLRLSPVTRW